MAFRPRTLSHSAMFRLLKRPGFAFIGMEVARVASHDYGDALSKCILFFEGQRSGKLPTTHRMPWRKDSALRDGSDIGVDLVGGYYDAGDNIKFSFPMAFTTTVLAWGVLEFGQFMGSDLKHALEAVRWGADYFLKATSVPGMVVAQVGDPSSDHDCWERPEDMDTLRTSYVVNRTHPGSEVSAEIAAVLAASSLVFKTSDPEYSKILLQSAYRAFHFANKYRGSYNPSVGQGVCPFYCDDNGYMDELIWGAAWLFKATKQRNFWKFMTKNIDSIAGAFTEFGWDAKQAGINILVYPWMKNASGFNIFVANADNFVCSILPESPTKSVTYSPGGLLFKPGPSNLQHTTALSFLLLVYARYLEASKRVVQCGNLVAPPSMLVNVARGQVNYVLGTNPSGMSYMVGYGKKFPQKIHHRGSTLPSIEQLPDHIGCHDGNKYFESSNPNPNDLVGAIVGGPDHNDQYVDGRYNVSQSEPATYINAPFVGVLAYFKSLPPK